MAFDRNVFINCPFDDEYLPLLRPLLFTTIYLGLNPRIALETLDSGQPRIDKIVRLITESRSPSTISPGSKRSPSANTFG